MPDVSPAVGKEFLFRRHQGHFCLVHKDQNKRPIILRFCIRPYDQIDGIQHNQSTHQALSDLKRTFYSMQDGFLTIRIPNILVRNELTETVNYLVELILERYYKHMS